MLFTEAIATLSKPNLLEIPVQNELKKGQKINF